MRKLLIYMKAYKKEAVLGPLFKLTEASFELFVPLVVAAIIDNGISSSDKSYIIKMGLLLFALAAIGLVCAITAQYFAAKASVGFAARLRSALFKHIQSLSFSQIDSYGTSGFITRMTSDINQVQSGVNMFLRLLLRSPFIVFGAMIMAFTVDAEAALVFVIAIPIMAIVVFGIMVVSIPLYRRVQEGLDRVLRLTRENLTGIRVIRAFNKENDEIEKFDEENDKLTNLQKFVGKISAVMNPATYIIVNAAIIAIIWIGAVRVDVGLLTQGEVIALVNYMSQILVELVKLATLIITVNKAFACAGRIEKVFEIIPGLTEGKTSEADIEDFDADAGVIFDHVSMMYADAGADSISDITFTAKRGETIGIIGGTGSGKSTLVNLIPRFYDVSSGNIIIDGKDVRDYDVDELRSRIGIVMQKAVLFKGSIRDNMRWGNPEAGDEQIYEALRIAQAKEFVDSKGEGLDFRIKQGGKNLSGGQRQRLTIARAIVRRPEILILDDSSSALDYATDACLRKSLREISGDMIMFIVSQRTSSIMHADRILVLEDGECVGIGTHEELLKNCGVYQEIYKIEVKEPESQY